MDYYPVHIMAQDFEINPRDVEDMVASIKDSGQLIDVVLSGDRESKFHSL